MPWCAAAPEPWPPAKPCGPGSDSAVKGLSPGSSRASSARTLLALTLLLRADCSATQASVTGSQESSRH